MSKQDNQMMTEGFKIDFLQQTLSDAVDWAKTKLNEIKSKSHDEINIGDMFDMQMLMNRLSQTSEMASSIVSASHQAILSLTKGIKGH
jgi:hypothetical protein